MIGRAIAAWRIATAVYGEPDLPEVRAALDLSTWPEDKLLGCAGRAELRAVFRHLDLVETRRIAAALEETCAPS